MSAKRLKLITLTGVILIVLVVAVNMLLTYATRDIRQTPLPDTQGSAPSASPSGGPADDGLIRVTVTADNVQNVISRLKRPVGYSRRVTVENYYENGSAVYEIHAAVVGDASAITVAAPGGTVKHIIVAGNMRFIWFDGDADYNSGPIDTPGAETRASDEYQMMLTYEDVLALDRADIFEAGYVTYGGERCIYLSYVSGVLGYETVCYVSVQTGLLTGAEQYDGEAVVYTMATSDYNSDVPDLAVFDLPDGSNAVSGL